MRIARVLALCLLPSLATAQSTTLQPVQVLHRFTPSPANPAGPLVQVPDGSFYGVTATGIIRLTTAGQVTQVATFLGDTPVGALVRASDGGLYGATQSFLHRGTIFRFDPLTGALRTVHTFRSSTEGRDPLGGLVAVGGSLYGVTRYGPANGTFGTIFHVVVATGQVVTDHVFGSTPAPLAIPATPLTVGPDGLLYGTTAVAPLGNLYRFDPIGGAVTSLRQFSVAEGANPGELVLGADGSLYGSASRGGIEEAGTIFRYTPATGIFQRLHSLTPSNGFDGRGPGPLVAGGDGHFYGITDAPNQGSNFPPVAGTLFRLRAGAGGTFTYETIRVLDRDVDGLPMQARLTLGVDGLLYGYAQSKGPTLAGTDAGAVLGGPTGPPGTGTLFRFDPSEPGPPSNPTAFTVLHAFPLLTRWDPSALVAATDGFLYGTLSAGGPTNRGATYRLNPATGAVTILADLPGALIGDADNSALIQGNDGFLYGTAQPSIVRIEPATGAGTVAAASLGMQGLARTPNGTMFGVQTVGQPMLLNFNPTTNALLTIAQLNGVNALSPVSTTSDGQTFLVAQRAVSLGGFSQFQRTWLMWPAASPTGVNTVNELLLGDDILAIDRLVEGAGGVLYLAARFTDAPAVVSVDRTTGAVRRVCAMTTTAPSTVFEHLSVGPGGALYGFVRGSGTQRLFRCDPTTGALTVSALPFDIGRVVGPLTNVGGVLYGATTGIYQSQGGVLFRFAPGGTLPALDTDGDTLPNEWETTYRLDPFSTGPGNGANDDPDGDSRTNAQELADGTHPRGFFRRLFAEGATGPFFRTRFDLTSPNADGATVRARFLIDTGAVIATDLIVRPQSHLDFDPATLPGLAHAAFSTIIESDTEVAVDRTMTWDASSYGSHLETGIAAPSTTWYFAEGSTSGDFALFYLLQNPQATAVTATVTYLRPSGLPPIVRTYTLLPNSRTTIVVDAETAELASTDLSAAITATAPIVAERAMYLSKPGQPFAAGHESAGVTAPALDWFLAEGATGAFFDLFVLIANPSATAATVEVEYLRTSGGPLTRTYTVPAESRMTIWVDDEELPAGSGQKPLANGSVSTTVRSTNAVPIIVERAMWWPGPTLTSNFWYEAHNSPGATGTATRWVLGGAELGGSDGAETYVLIANTTSTPAQARVSIVSDDFFAAPKMVDLPAKSRTTVSVRSDLQVNVPINGRVGVLVESLGENPVPLVVERATYASPGGVLWSSGGNALASPVP